MATWTNGTKSSSTFTNQSRGSVAKWSDAIAKWSDAVFTWGGVATAWVNQPLGYYQEITDELGNNLLLESGNEIVTETSTATTWSLQTKN